MFRASSRPSSGAQQLQWQPLVLPLERGGSSAVGHGRAGRPDRDQQHRKGCIGLEVALLFQVLLDNKLIFYVLWNTDARVISCNN